MNAYDEKIKTFLLEKNIEAEHLGFAQSCHSVEEAARAAGVTREDFVKSICMVGEVFIVAVVKGEDKASTSRVGKALGIDSPRIATPEEMLEATGYPCGGTPAFGYEATFLIDPRVMEKDIVYSGGGSERSLIRMSPKEMQRANKGTIARIRK